MTTLEKIRDEIEQTAKDYDKFDDYRRVRGLWIALDIIDKYAEQEPTDENLHREREQAYMQGYEDASKRFRQEPCDDVVSRQAVLDESFEVDTREYGRIEVVGVDAIAALPPVTLQPKTGHWIEEDVFDGDVAYRCSECNELFWLESGTPKDNEYNFCPKCGKGLVEPQESEV